MAQELLDFDDGSYNGTSTVTRDTDWAKFFSSLSGLTGANLAFDIPLDITSEKRVAFQFKRIPASSWYDDDFTDGALHFYLIIDEPRADITYYTTEWNYRLPIVASLPRLAVYMRRSSNLAIRIVAKDKDLTAFTIDLSVSSSFSSGEWDGSDPITIDFNWESGSLVVNVYGSDGSTVRQSGSAASFAGFATPTNDSAFIIHHHNYKTYNASLFEQISDLTIYSGASNQTIDADGVGLLAYGSSVVKDGLQNLSVCSSVTADAETLFYWVLSNLFGDGELPTAWLASERADDAIPLATAARGQQEALSAVAWGALGLAGDGLSLSYSALVERAQAAALSWLAQAAADGRLALALGLSAGAISEVRLNPRLRAALMQAIERRIDLALRARSARIH